MIFDVVLQNVIRNSSEKTQKDKKKKWCEQINMQNWNFVGQEVMFC